MSVVGITLAGITSLASFDASALIGALDAQRADRDLGRTELAEKLTLQSADLNAQLADHAMCPGALVRTARRGTMSCQYALILLRWLRNSDARRAG